MKVVIASDHGGYKLKRKLAIFLTKLGCKVIDLGTTNINNVDFPDYAFKVGEMVAKKEVDYGIAICSTGIGMSIACNKVKGIRCALSYSKKDAEISRKHNDANVLAIRGNMTLLTAEEVVRTFLTTKPLKEPRYKRRNNKIEMYEDKHAC